VNRKKIEKFGSLDGFENMKFNLTKTTF